MKKKKSLSLLKKKKMFFSIVFLCCVRHRLFDGPFQSSNIIKTITFSTKPEKNKFLRSFVRGKNQI